MKILIAGIGALGSNLCANLVADGRGELDITVLDFDKVEERNLLGTQYYFPGQEGLLKTQALQYSIYQHFNREISFIDGKIEKMTTELILSNYDLAIDAFDNYEARLTIQEWWRALKYSGPNKLHCPDLIHCGFSKDMTFAIEFGDNYSVPTDIVNGPDICELPGAASFIKMVSALASQTVQHYIKTNQKKEFIGNKFSFTEIK